MNPVIIANPPMGIYKPFTLGHAAYHVWLDILYRDLSANDATVICPRYSLNAFGKKADELPGDDAPVVKGRTLLRDNLAQGGLRDKLGLAINGKHTDDSEAVITAAMSNLFALDQRGYLLRKGDDLYLDTPAIVSTTPFLEAAAQIEYYPQRARTEFMRMLKDNVTEPVRITRLTNYAPANPLCANNIGPLFVLASSWDVYPKCDLILACSTNTLAKYALLRYSVSMGVRSEPGMTQVYTFPRVEIGTAAASVAGRMLDECPDAFRYACAKAHTLERETAKLTTDCLEGGRRLTMQLRHTSHILDSPAPGERKDASNLSVFKFTKELNLLEGQLGQLSKKINAHKRTAEWPHKKAELAKEYSMVLSRFAPILPSTVASCCTEVTHETYR